LKISIKRMERINENRERERRRYAEGAKERGRMRIKTIEMHKRWNEEKRKRKEKERRSKMTAEERREEKRKWAEERTRKENEEREERIRKENEKREEREEKEERIRKEREETKKKEQEEREKRELIKKEKEERIKIIETQDCKKFAEFKDYGYDEWIQSVRFRRLNFIQWLNNNNKNGFCDQVVIYAAKCGYLEILDWLIKHRKNLDINEVIKKMDSSELLIKVVIQNAAWRVRDEGLIQKQPEEKKVDPSEEKALKAFSKLGLSNDMIKFINDNDGKAIQNGIDYAAEQGNLAAVKGFHSLGKTCTTNAMNQAARRGFQEIVEYIDNNMNVGCTERAIDWAAENGHARTVDYLLKKGKPCTEYAINAAAANGHTAIVELLHLAGKKCTSEAMDQAAKGNHFDTVKFLHKNCEVSSFHATELIAQEGHLDMLQWFYIYRRDECHKELEIYWAKQKGKQNIIDWLNKFAE
jgi:hypothetical protein